MNQTKSHTVLLHAVCEDNSTERCTYISVGLRYRPY